MMASTAWLAAMRVSHDELCRYLRTLARRLCSSCGCSFCTSPSWTAAARRVTGEEPVSKRRNKRSSLLVMMPVENRCRMEATVSNHAHNSSASALKSSTGAVHVFLWCCSCSVALAPARPGVKKRSPRTKTLHAAIVSRVTRTEHCHKKPNSSGASVPDKTRACLVQLETCCSLSSSTSRCADFGAFGSRPHALNGPNQRPTASGRCLR